MQKAYSLWVILILTLLVFSRLFGSRAAATSTNGWTKKTENASAQNAGRPGRGKRAPG